MLVGAQAYDRAILRLKGEEAVTNFPPSSYGELEPDPHLLDASASGKDADASCIITLQGAQPTTQRALGLIVGRDACFLRVLYIASRTSAVSSAVSHWRCGLELTSCLLMYICCAVKGSGKSRWLCRSR